MCVDGLECLSCRYSSQQHNATDHDVTGRQSTGSQVGNIYRETELEMVCRRNSSWTDNEIRRRLSVCFTSWLSLAGERDATSVDQTVMT